MREEKKQLRDEKKQLRDEKKQLHFEKLKLMEEGNRGTQSIISGSGNLDMFYFMFYLFYNATIPEVFAVLFPLLILPAPTANNTIGVTFTK